MATKKHRAAGVFVAVALLLATLAVLLLPPAPRPLTGAAAPDPRTVRGALHVHTIRSDGGGTVGEVAAAAARAGLQFVVVADHGNGRGLAAPVYRSGVLCIDGVEIGTDDGHLVAMGFREPEFPLGGEGRDAIEDVHRLGGVAIVAHPASPKPELAWRDWRARFDAVEWLNADSEWRDESVLTLARLAASYPLRPPGAVAAAFDRPLGALARLDEVAARRSVVAVAGHDAHARLGADGGAGSGVSLPLPSYESVFRSFAIRAVLERPFSGNAADDAAAVVRAIRHGRVYTAIDAVAVPGRFSFTARSGSAEAEIGGRVIPAGPLEFEIQADAPPDATIVLLHEGREVAAAPPPRLSHERPPVPGAYRAEVRVPGAPGAPPVPWILTSTIHVGIPSGSIEPVPPPLRDSIELSSAPELNAWRIEHGPGSTGELSADGADALRFVYSLGLVRAQSPYVAAVRPVRPPAGVRALAFRARADRPMRLSVQVRAPGGGDGRRWRRSVFLDEGERTFQVALADMRPAAGAAGEPPAALLDALLFVVDTVHADPGASGTVWLGGVRVGGG